MKAIQIDGDRLVWADAPSPSPGPGEIRIDVHATAVNRADLVQRAGGYPPPPGASEILGLECAGTVSEVGEGVTRVSPGQAVCALLAGGGYAEQVVVPAGQVLPIPAGLDFHQAAALPEVFATAYLNLFMEAGLEKGERVLIHAGASGVGTAAIQLCRAFHNPCFVTAGGDEKIARCVALGAEGGFDRHDGDFQEAVRSWAGERGVDVILDVVGAAYFAQNVACLGLRGRLLLVGLMGGVQTDVNLGMLMMKRLRVIGSTLRARPVAEKARVMDALWSRVWPLFGDGSVKPVIEAVMPVQDAEEAHRLVESNETVGKVVLAVR